MTIAAVRPRWRLVRRGGRGGGGWAQIEYAGRCCWTATAAERQQAAGGPPGTTNDPAVGTRTVGSPAGAHAVELVRRQRGPGPPGLDQQVAGVGRAGVGVAGGRPPHQRVQRRCEPGDEASTVRARRSARAGRRPGSGCRRRTACGRSASRRAGCRRRRRRCGHRRRRARPARARGRRRCRAAPCCRWLVVSVVTARARPKSATLTRPSSASRTFSGLMSRWMMPVQWAAASASSTGSSRESASRGVSRPRSLIRSRSVRPGTYSMTRNHEPVVLALVVDRDDAGVGEPGGRAGLADEPAQELLVLGQVGVHHLEGDLAVQPLVDREVDGRHAAAGDPRLDGVPTLEHAAHQRVRDGRIHPRSLRSTRRDLGDRSVAAVAWFGRFREPGSLSTPSQAPPRCPGASPRHPQCE